jgi:hypothetical protein
MQTQSTKPSLSLQMSKSHFQTEEEINDMVSKITLKKPRNPYHIFISEMVSLEKKKNSSLTIGQISSKYTPNWHRYTDNEKMKYYLLADEEKEKYKKEIETVKNVLFGDYIKQGSSAFHIFIDECVKNAFENDKDTEEAKREAYEKWKTMTPNEKKAYSNKKKQNDDWWERAKHSSYVNSYAVFVQKKISDCKSKNKVIGFKECSLHWSKMSLSEKLKYDKLAKEFNEERRRMKELYEIVQGIKPKKPAGAFKLFLQEKAKEKQFVGKNAFKEGKRLWGMLSEEEKDKYLKKSHKVKLCYMYKKMLYDQKVRKSRPKNKSALNFFMHEYQGKKIPKDLSFFTFVHQEWKKLDKDGKKKYMDLAEKDKAKCDKIKEKLNSKVFDFPKKPKNAYQFYIAEMSFQMKEEKPEMNIVDIMNECSGKWNKMNEEDKKKFVELSHKDKERFDRQVEEFNERGFYTQKNGDINLVTTQSQRMKKKGKGTQSSKK